MKITKDYEGLTKKEIQKDVYEYELYASLNSNPEEDIEIELDGKLNIAGQVRAKSLKSNNSISAGHGISVNIIEVDGDVISDTRITCSRINASGSIICNGLESKRSIKSGANINSASGIIAGQEIEAKGDIISNSKIFAGVCITRAFFGDVEFENKNTIKCKKISGKIECGDLILTGESND